MRWTRLLIQHGLHGLRGEGGVAERAVRLRRGADRRSVRVHVAKRENAVVQRVRVRTTRAPRTAPAHLALLREYLLHVKREAA